MCMYIKNDIYKSTVFLYYEIASGFKSLSLIKSLRNCGGHIDLFINY